MPSGQLSKVDTDSLLRRRFLLRFFLIFGSLLVASTIAGSLNAPDFTGHQALSDLDRLLLIRRESTPSSTSFPLLRDYSAWIHMWMIAAMATWGGHLFRQIEIVLPRLEADGGMVVTDQANFDRIINTANAILRSRITHVAAILGAFTFTATGLLAYSRYGIYSFFSPVGVSEASFSSLAFSHWWARPFQFPSFIWMFWATIGNYIIIWISLVCVLITAIFQRLKSYVGYQVSDVNYDGRWGWTAVTDIVATGRKIAIAATIGVMAIALIANPSSYVYLFLFLISFFVAVLLFLTPNHFYGRAYDRLQQDRVRRMHSMDTGEATIYALKLDSIPEHIVRTRDFIYQLTVVTVPGIVAVINYLQSTQHHGH